MKDKQGNQLYCTCGKAIYSQKEVYIKLNQFKRWKNANSKAKHPIRVYHCELCNEWHLTSRRSYEVEHKKRQNNKKNCKKTGKGNIY